jgi:hypothetical protein
MKKIIILFTILFSVSSLFAQPAETLSVTITPGTAWNKKRGPQHAVWIEKADGTFVTTLFATQRAVKNNWLFAPKGGRPESLPVWYHASGKTAAENGNRTYTDVISSATPSQKKTYSKTLQFAADTIYVVKVEVNNSFDYNEYWPKKAKKTDQNYSGVNGQPSVVYSGIITPQLKNNSLAKIELRPAGTGSVNGSDGIIHDNLNSLTTALLIISKIQAELE